MSERDEGNDRVRNTRLTRARQSLTSPSGSGQEMSPQELAEALNTYLWGQHGHRGALDRSYISKLELGRHHWPNALYREAFRHVLGVATDAELGFYARQRVTTSPRRPEPQDGHANISAQPSFSGVPEAVRSAIVMADPPINSDSAPISAPQLQALTARTQAAYQGARYDEAMALAPTLMSAVSFVAASHEGNNAVIASAHLALSKLMLKFGDAHLAWITADRARALACNGGRPELQTAALFSIGCALHGLPGRQDEAQDLVHRGLESANAPTTAVHISVLGALTLLSAVIASRQNDHRQARVQIDAAISLADRLDSDRNDLWTGFGPTNVLIHQVGIAATTDPTNAIILGERLDTSHLPHSLVSRRAQVHLDLASAFTQRPDGDASALLHLLQAERVAPQLLKIHPPARASIVNLLSRERRSVTPGLRELATRSGVEA